MVVCRNDHAINWAETVSGAIPSGREPPGDFATRHLPAMDPGGGKILNGPFTKVLSLIRHAEWALW